MEQDRAMARLQSQHMLAKSLQSAPRLVGVDASQLRVTSKEDTTRCLLPRDLHFMTFVIRRTGSFESCTSSEDACQWLAHIRV